MRYYIRIVIGAAFVVVCNMAFAAENRGSVNSVLVATAEAGTVVGAPEALHLKIVQNGFQLNWTASPQDPGTVTGYEIVRSDRFSGPYEPVATVEKGTSRYIDTTAAREIIYFYKMRAIAGSGYSDFSNTVTGER